MARWFSWKEPRPCPLPGSTRRSCVSAASVTPTPSGPNRACGWERSRPRPSHRWSRRGWSAGVPNGTSPEPCCPGCRPGCTRPPGCCATAWYASCRRHPNRPRPPPLRDLQQQERQRDGTSAAGVGFRSPWRGSAGPARASGHGRSPSAPVRAPPHGESPESAPPYTSPSPCPRPTDPSHTPVSRAQPPVRPAPHGVSSPTPQPSRW